MATQRVCKSCGRPLSDKAHPLTLYHRRCRHRELKARYRARLKARRAA